MVDCILITNHFTKRLFTYRAVQYFAAQNEEKYQGNVVPVVPLPLYTFDLVNNLVRILSVLSLMYYKFLYTLVVFLVNGKNE